jgi:hypothetical protein
VHAGGLSAKAGYAASGTYAHPDADACHYAGMPLRVNNRSRHIRRNNCRADSSCIRRNKRRMDNNRNRRGSKRSPPSRRRARRRPSPSHGASLRHHRASLRHHRASLRHLANRPAPPRHPIAPPRKPPMAAPWKPPPRKPPPKPSRAKLVFGASIKVLIAAPATSASIFWCMIHFLVVTAPNS